MGAQYSPEWAAEVYSRFVEANGRATECALKVLGISDTKVIGWVQKDNKSWYKFKVSVHQLQKWLSHQGTVGSLEAEEFLIIVRQWARWLLNTGGVTNQKMIDRLKIVCSNGRAPIEGMPSPVPPGEASQLLLPFGGS